MAKHRYTLTIHVSGAGDLSFQIRDKTRMSKVFRAYASVLDLNEDRLCFQTAAGVIVAGDDTARSLNLHEGDTLKCSHTMIIHVSGAGDVKFKIRDKTRMSKVLRAYASRRQHLNEARLCFETAAGVTVAGDDTARSLNLHEGDTLKCIWIYAGEEEQVPHTVTHVRVSANVTILPGNAFRHRGNLAIVELNDGLVEIGVGAFRLCSSLESIQIPSSVETIGEIAFSYCDQLRHVEIPEDGRLRDIKECAFIRCCSLAEIRLPGSLRKLGEGAFVRCIAMKRADLESTKLTAIEEGTFAMDSEENLLEEVRLPVTIEEIGEEAFRDCYNLSSITLHEGTKTISASAFHGCHNLSFDKLPSTVETIGQKAFLWCNLWHFMSPPCCKELYLSALAMSKDEEHIFCSRNWLKSIQIIDDCTRIKDGYVGLTTPYLLRMNVPKSFYENESDTLPGSFDPGPFFSNLLIQPNSTMTEDFYNNTFSGFNEKGCTLDRMKFRFQNLPLHEMCFDYSNQNTEITFEQVVECLERNVDALREKDCIGMTPLHIIACSTNHDVRLFQKLICSSHETISDRDIFGRTALDYALLSDAPAEVFYLLFEPLVKMGELPLDLELVDKVVQNDMSSLQTWEVFSDYAERFFPAFDLDWERLFSKKVHPNSDMLIEKYLWFARKAVKQRMIKMNTLTSDRLLVINKMIDGYQARDKFETGTTLGENEFRRQVGPVWKRMQSWELKEATILLELALWKCRLGASCADSDTREVARISCGAGFVINEVVQYLYSDDDETGIFGELFSLEDVGSLSSSSSSASLSSSLSEN